MVQGVAEGPDHIQERSLPPGHVRELCHHGGLWGVQSVMVGPVDDPLSIATP